VVESAATIEKVSWLKALDALRNNTGKSRVDILIFFFLKANLGQILRLDKLPEIFWMLARKELIVN